MKVLGTAGHIDHGKSTLVERLTGVNPDRLEEERRRGMTIELGFGSLTLPNGETVGVVDVPGHERFVRAMVAGAGGIDVALLVIAADEGVMPQTREHVDILRLLDVRTGVVALTKKDLADPELIELVEEDVRGLLRDTSLNDSAIIPVSSVTGSGIPELLAALEHAVSSAQERSPSTVAFLPVDRVFTLTGHGTVVTGTLHGGQLEAGSKVEIVPGHRLVRVRSIQVHGRTVATVRGGSRVALNLVMGKEDIRRGDIVAVPDSIVATQCFDGLVEVLPSASIPLRHGMEMTLHTGSAEQSARVSLLGTSQLLPGERGWLRARCKEPLALVHGMRFILRLPSPARTVAGGEVLDVAPRLQVRDPRLLPRLEALRSSDEMTRLQALLPTRHPHTASEIAVAAGVTAKQAEEILTRLESLEASQKLGRGWVSHAGWQDLRASVLAVLQDFAEKQPLKAGMLKEEVRARLRLEPAAWNDLLGDLAGQGEVVDLGASIALRGRQGGTVSRRDEADRVLQLLKEGWFSPPNRAELLITAKSDQSVLDALTAEGAAVKLNEDIYLSEAAYRAMAGAVVELIRARGPITVAEVRDALRVTRKYALAITEQLDSVYVTKRVGDTRVLGRRAPQCV